MKIQWWSSGLTLLAALGAFSVACAQVLLVTEAEAEASRSAPTRFTAKSVPAPGAPRIILQTPNISHPVASPLRIRLRFQPTAPAVILPGTFRVFYGMFELDITRRITELAKVSREGLEISEARLPLGTHSLLIELQDSLGRRGRHNFQFVVD
ncbi:MAG: hypothetical protein OEY03_10580 [Rhizobacter sp.]|nr:hypothetical protein [Rhizobacter sp.]